MISGFSKVGDSVTSIMLFCQMCHKEVQCSLRMHKCFILKENVF
jgi:pentatricopeptide repeat protein